MRLLTSGALRDRLRLWSGLVLFTFALTHFLNHALGLLSLEAMIRVQDWRLAVTRSPPGSALLVVAALTHAGLALWKLAGLRNFRLRAGEWWQALTGFAIPFLLAPHLFEAGVGPRMLGISAAYPGLLRLIWPAAMISQTLLLLVVWTHGVLGLHFWPRWFPRSRSRARSRRGGRRRRSPRRPALSPTPCGRCFLPRPSGRRW
jgi:adenylate cyclase